MLECIASFNDGFFRALRVTVPHTLRSKLTAGGQPARHEKIGKTVETEFSLIDFGLFRIEGYIRTHDETRQYAERLIELAKKYGDRYDPLYPFSSEYI